MPVCRACLSAPRAAGGGILLRFLPDSVSESFSAGCGRTLRALPVRIARLRLGLLFRGLRGHVAATDPPVQVRPDEAAGPPLGDLLAAALPRDQRFDGVVAVPLHWRRKWERGFNQSELLARVDRAPLRRCRCCIRCAARRATRAQAGLSNTIAGENVAGAFSAKAGAVEGLRILLVDDVMTTGATASACAQRAEAGGSADRWRC